jgi:hypothetical protein
MPVADEIAVNGKTKSILRPCPPVRLSFAPFAGFLGFRIALSRPKLRLNAASRQAVELALYESCWEVRCALDKYGSCGCLLECRRRHRLDRGEGPPVSAPQWSPGRPQGTRQLVISPVGGSPVPPGYRRP